MFICLSKLHLPELTTLQLQYVTASTHLMQYHNTLKLSVNQHLLTITV